MPKSKRIKILVIQQSPDWGGAEEWMASLVEQWRKSKVEVIAYTNLDSLRKRWKDAGAKVGSIPMVLDIIGNFRGLVKSIVLLPWAVIFYFRLLKMAKRSGVRTVVISGFSEKLVVSWLAYFMGMAVVWYEYAPLKTLFRRNFYIPKLAYRLTKFIPKRVIALSENTKKFFVLNEKIDKNKLKMIYPGVKVYKNRKKNENNDLIVGSLSRVTIEKGQRLLLSSWRRVVDILPNAKLVIAGTGPDVEIIKKMAKDLEIERSVEILGFIEDKNKFYEKLSLFVFPSIWELEGFGLVMAEALSFGVPVAAFDNGASKEVVNEQVGKLVGEMSEKALAGAIVEELKNKNLVSKRDEAKKLAENKFNLTRQADLVLKEINDVAKGN